MRSGLRTAGLAFLVDLALVALFIALGRRTHDGTGMAGFLHAGWPFMAALAIAWVGVIFSRGRDLGRRRGEGSTHTGPTGTARSNVTAQGGTADSRLSATDTSTSWPWTQVWPLGVIVWLVTAAGGLGIRAASGGGLAGGFPYVTLGVLGAFLLGWRALGYLKRRVAP